MRNRYGQKDPVILFLIILMVLFFVALFLIMTRSI